MKLNSKKRFYIHRYIPYISVATCLTNFKKIGRDINFYLLVSHKSLETNSITKSLTADGDENR